MAGIRQTPNSNVQTTTITYPSQATGSTPQLQIINSPGGGKGQIQFHSGNGSFSGDSNFVWNSKNRTMSILGNVRISENIIGKYYTNLTNFKITGGNSGQVLSTDGTGNLFWVPAVQVDYGNSNVANYLPTYTGNVSANYFIGNGSQLTNINISNIAGSYSNSNVANYLPTYTGNVSANYFIGNGSQLTGLPTQYSNSNVANYLPTYTGNVSANYFIGNGSQLTNINISNIAGSYSDSNVANYLPTYTGNLNGGNLTITGTSYIYDISSTGSASLTTANVSANLTTNAIYTDNYFYANGTPYGGGGSELVNGNNSFVLDGDGNVVFEGNIAGQAIDRGLVWDYGANANGVNSMVRQDNNGLTVRAYTTDGGGANGFSASVNIVTNQDANAKTWIFDGNGNFTLPGNLIVPAGNIVSGDIAPTFDSVITDITTGNATVIVTLVDAPFGGPVQGQVTISGVTGTTEADGTWYYEAVDGDAFELFTDSTFSTPIDGTSWTPYISGGNAVSTGTYTNLTIQGNISIGSNDKIWTFDPDGNLTLAGGNSVIQSIANSSLDPLNPNTSTMVFTPDPNYSSQSLVIDPTGPSHIHLRSPGANIDEPDANIFLGGEESSFEVGYYNGSAPNLFIHSGGNTWTFGADSNLTLPSGGNLIVSGSIVSSGASPAPTLSGFSSVSALSFTNGNSNVTINSNSNSWVFDSVGNLTLPGNTFAINYANGTQVSIGGGSSSNISNGNSIIDIATLDGNITLDANGNTFTFGTDGNLTTPSNLVIGSSPVGGSSILQYNDVLQIVGEGANAITLMGWAANQSAPDSVAVIGMNTPYANGASNVLIAVGNNATTVNYWNFDSAGNLTLPGNTFSVNYANGTQISLGGSSYSNSDVVTLLGSFGNNTITTTGNISGGNLLASANVLGNGYAKFSGTFDESQASTAGLYLGYAGGTPRMMFGTGNTSQTFEIDNDGGNLRFYQPGSTKATLTSGGAFSAAGNVTGANITTAGNVAFTANSSAIAFNTGAFISGNANSITRDGSILLQPYTGVGSTFPGVIIGGAGRLLAPNGGVFQIFNSSDVTFQVPVKVTSVTAATSTITGALIVSGGAGLAGSITTGVGALLTGPTFTPLANTMAGFVSNVNSYTQLTIQNKSTGADATTDFVATADNGTDTVNYLDLGIINSGYDNLTPTNSLGNIVYAADSYLYAQGNVSNTSQSGGNLAIGTTVAGKSVKIFAGGANANSIIATVSNTGLAVNGNVTATNFSGNISITGNVTGTSPNVTLVAGSYSYIFDNAGTLTLPTGITGNEGGEIAFTQAANSTLGGNTVVIDQYVDRIRFFEGGGNARGAYIDFTQAADGVATLLNNRVSGLVNAGTFVTMDLIKATVTSSGNRGLSLAATTGSFSIQIGGSYSVSGGTNGSSGTATITTTPSSSQFNWNFGANDIATYIITDTTNSRAYRITLQIGASFNNNLISIERLV